MRQSDGSPASRIEVVLKQTSAPRVTYCMYRREKGGVGDKFRKELVGSRDKHVEVQRGKFLKTINNI